MILALLLVGADVSVESIPRSTEEFVALRDKIAVTPEGGIVMWLVAAVMHGEDPKLGEQAMVIALDQSNLTAGNTYKGYAIGSGVAFYLKASTFKPYYGRGYVQGTKPDDQYKLPPAPYKFVVNKHTQQPSDPKKWKGLVPNSCADNPKPFDVIKNDKGIWKVDNPSSFFAGCKVPPAAPKGDDL